MIDLTFLANKSKYYFSLYYTFGKLKTFLIVNEECSKVFRAFDENIEENRNIPVMRRKIILFLQSFGWNSEGSNA